MINENILYLSLTVIHAAKMTLFTVNGPKIKSHENRSGKTHRNYSITTVVQPCLSSMVPYWMPRRVS